MHSCMCIYYPSFVLRQGIVAVWYITSTTQKAALRLSIDQQIARQFWGYIATYQAKFTKRYKNYILYCVMLKSKKSLIFCGKNQLHL